MRMMWIASSAFYFPRNTRDNRASRDRRRDSFSRCNQRTNLSRLDDPRYAKLPLTMRIETARA